MTTESLKKADHAALLAFLNEEKSISERQIKVLKIAKSTLNRELEQLMKLFSIYQLKSLPYLPKLVWIFFRMEGFFGFGGVNNKLSTTSGELSYHTDAFLLITKALAVLPKGNFAPVIKALDHISKFRPISPKIAYPNFAHQGNFSQPRYVARFFHDLLTELTGENKKL